MSGPSVEEKLQRHPTSSGIRAQAKLSQLRAMYGFVGLVGDDKVQLISMEGLPDIWKRLSGRGEESMFERIDEGAP